MTTPQQPPPQQPPPSGAAALDAVIIAAIGLQLLTATSATVASVALYREYGKGMRAMLIPPQALQAAIQIPMSFPPAQTGFYGPATMQMERLNRQRRSAFVLAAARRIGSDLIAARSRGQSVPAALAAAVTRERRFYSQHLEAIWQRSQAGAQTDSAAMTYGLLLGWHTVKDAKTSADCLAANGKNFYADHMPLIGYPGAVHPHCRCLPGAPFPGARLLPSYGIPTSTRYRRAA
jgi:hypothetical protein